MTSGAGVARSVERALAARGLLNPRPGEGSYRFRCTGGVDSFCALGTRFLGHVERCAVLIHLVDATGEDVAGAYRTVREELAAYGAGLEDKPEVVEMLSKKIPMGRSGRPD